MARASPRLSRWVRRARAGQLCPRIRRLAHERAPIAPARGRAPPGKGRGPATSRAAAPPAPWAVVLAAQGTAFGLFALARLRAPALRAAMRGDGHRLAAHRERRRRDRRDELPFSVARALPGDLGRGAARRAGARSGRACSGRARSRAWRDSCAAEMAEDLRESDGPQAIAAAIDGWRATPSLPRRPSRRRNAWRGACAQAR